MMSTRRHGPQTRWERGRLGGVTALVAVVLLVLTVVAAQKALVGTRPASPPPDRPSVREAAPVAGPRPGPTGVLPPGGAYPERGGGDWDVVPLPSDRPISAAPATGRLVTYTVEVENGMQPVAYGGDTIFAADVEATLAHPRGWLGSGVVLRRVDVGEPDIRVSLTSSTTAMRPDWCGGGIPFESSCHVKPRVVINAARWVRGALAFGGDMVGYRQYVVNHEVGHALGEGHVGCEVDGAPAPVMMQQTFGTANDYVSGLNGVDRYSPNAVPADGKTCLANPWPAPSGR